MNYFFYFTFNVRDLLRWRRSSETAANFIWNKANFAAIAIATAKNLTRFHVKFGGCSRLAATATSLLLAILGMAHLCCAQKLHRHEITVGYYGGYYFDETPFRFQNLKGNKTIPTLTYLFRLDKSFHLGVLYGRHDIGGEKIDVSNINDFENAVLGRISKHYVIYGGYRRELKYVNANITTGLNYRTGFKSKFLYQYNHGNWVESFFEYKDYKDIGVSLGVTLQHPIVKRFFGELSINYIRYFSDFDKKLLIPGYRIGFRF